MTRRRILILDTSILCCWLQIPGKETAGPNEDKWNYKRISDLLEQEKIKNSTFVLPIAALIETGNHIAQAHSKRFECANLLVDCLRKSFDAHSPWAAFIDQSPLWEKNNLLQLANEWPQLALTKLTIGDATIKNVAEYYARTGWSVEILTGDKGLKAYEPAVPVVTPRRRS